jgi:hypothetical protein
VPIAGASGRGSPVLESSPDRSFEVRVGDDALMNRYATDRVWPLYVFFGACVLVGLYLFAAQAERLCTAIPAR